jgi:hypothetical protein
MQPCIISLCAGIALLYLKQDAYDRYLNATGAVPDSQTPLLLISPERYGQLRSLFFNIGGVNISTSSYQVIITDVLIYVTLDAL